jgi:unsaturated chondroitin disaccharide hydrolase
MANLPLLYWAAKVTGDGSFRLVGEAHALATADALVRKDMSTYHAVEYDVVTGSRVRGYTFQGFSDESTWSRGQAWAVLGFAATAGATGKVRYLNLAERLADYFLRRLGSDTAPYWDFDDPAIPDAPRDSSAAAILSSVLLDIADLHPDPREGVARREQSLVLLDGLCRDHLAREERLRGLLAHGCYSRPHDEGIDSAVLFGDFYFAEALCKVLMPGRFQPVPARLSPAGGVPL